MLNISVILNLVTQYRISIMLIKSKLKVIIHLLAEAYNFTENSADRKWMDVHLTQTGMRAKVIEVHTLDSPSWVAWRRVRFWAQNVR